MLLGKPMIRGNADVPLHSSRKWSEVYYSSSIIQDITDLFIDSISTIEGQLLM